jgi:hypothetical protein
MAGRFIHGCIRPLGGTGTGCGWNVRGICGVEETRYGQCCGWTKLWQGSCSEGNFLCNTLRVLVIFDFHKNLVAGAHHLAERCGHNIIVIPDFWRKDLLIDNVLLRERQFVMPGNIPGYGTWEVTRRGMDTVVERTEDLRSKDVTLQSRVRYTKLLECLLTGEKLAQFAVCKSCSL